MTTKRAAFFDVDNTLIKGSTIFFLSRGMYQRGFFTKREVSNFVLVNLRYRLTGKENPDEINKFKEAAQAFIKGHKVKEMTDIAADVYEKYVSQRLWDGTIEIAKNHLDQGLEVWLVTAAPQEMAELISQRLGFSGALGTVAETKDGVYTGKMIGEMLHGKFKADAVKRLAQNRGINLGDSFAYSDSHHDIPLLSLVGKPQVINPDTLLQIKAFRDNWPIHDFRRARRISAALAPVLARAVYAATFLKPRRRQGK
jgi:HAD superfamily hydrolase (TIGR01490 family)